MDVDYSVWDWLNGGAFGEGWSDGWFWMRQVKGVSGLWKSAPRVQVIGLAKWQMEMDSKLA